MTNCKIVTGLDRTSDVFSGRWETAGAELFTLKDRQKHQFCLGPVSGVLFCLLVTCQLYQD